jgi:TetR/AcrR family transcriptional repressor of lmrAB and yxaGH operons
MAHRLISDEDFLATALDLFRTYGFEGVSLKQLADATGLEKASLYYRFPGGKDAIAMAIAGMCSIRWLAAGLHASV